MKTFKWLDEIIENVRVKQPANFKNLKDVIVSRLPDLVRLLYQKSYLLKKRFESTVKELEEC